MVAAPGEPALYPCRIVHVRTGRPRRAFSYRSYLWLVDLDQLPALPRLWRPLASFRVRDHLGRPDAPSIRSNINGYLADRGIDLDGGRVLMLANAATFGYIFNPLSVFWCFDADGAVAAVLAEVHNTYGERHVYLLHPDRGGRAGARKDFYVSPFLPMRGGYRMRLPEPGESLQLGVTLVIDSAPLLVASVRGSRRQFTLGRLAAYSVRFPLAPARVSLLIRWQGIRFVRPRRAPGGAMNAISTEFEPADTNPPPGLTKRPAGPDLPEPGSGRARPLIARALIRTATGRLPISINLPDGAVIGTGGQGTPTVVVHDDAAFFARIGTGTAGFAESYMAGDWDCDDLPGLFAVLARHVRELLPAPVRALRRLYIPRKPAEEDDTVEGARRNIARHYDLSNDFFELFLDPTMTYSSGLFDPGDSLERAQLRKIDRLLDQAGVGPGTRLLEIGTGWGALAVRAAARGATVTTVTNSAQQWQLARRRAASAGRSSRIEHRLCDYREITGEYDAVISVEMIEAVGIRYLPDYFAIIDRVLVPGGRAALQAITMPHEQMVATRNGQTWMHQYIFPGGQIPSRQAIEQSLAGTSLRISSQFAMGPHYATTLARWRDQFARAQADVLALGFSPAFIRMWDLYLAYSAGGFQAGYLNVYQLGLDRTAS